MIRNVKIVAELESPNSDEMLDVDPPIFPVEPVMEKEYQPFTFAAKYQQLLQAFDEYAKHRYDCIAPYEEGFPCSCGLSALRREFNLDKGPPCEPHGFVVPK